MTEPKKITYPKLPTGKPIRFVLPDLAGKPVDLLGTRGQPTLLFFFTTWDLRSTSEAPLIAQLTSDLKESGLQTIGIVLDREVNPAVIKAFVDYMGFTFPVLRAQPDSPALTSTIGGIRRVPRTIVLDRNGLPRFDQQGQTDIAELRTLLERMLSRS